MKYNSWGLTTTIISKKEIRGNEMKEEKEREWDEGRLLLLKDVEDDGDGGWEGVRGE